MGMGYKVSKGADFAVESEKMQHSNVVLIVQIGFVRGWLHSYILMFLPGYVKRFRWALDILGSALVAT